MNSWGLIYENGTVHRYNTAHTLRTNAFTLRDIVPFSRNAYMLETLSETNIMRTVMNDVKCFRPYGTQKKNNWNSSLLWE